MPEIYKMAFCEACRANNDLNKIKTGTSSSILFCSNCLSKPKNKKSGIDLIDEKISNLQFSIDEFGIQKMSIKTTIKILKEIKQSLLQ